ncbi:MAG: hypothetical protein H7Y32_13725 [Chloroflexales bacterium]|nr:hypothetical protein [Chloroflexales bacterium]
MDPEETDDAGRELPVLGRQELVAQVQARLAGSLDANSLAAWAYARFYEEEMEQLSLEPGADDLLREVLDELMFADDASFALDDNALRALLARLQP